MADVTKDPFYALHSAEASVRFMAGMLLDEGDEGRGNTMTLIADQMSSALRVMEEEQWRPLGKLVEAFGTNGQIDNQ